MISPLDSLAFSTVTSSAVVIQHRLRDATFIIMILRRPTRSGNYDTLNDAAGGKIFTAFIQDASTYKSIWESPRGSKEGVFSVTLDANVNFVELCFDIEKDVDDDVVEEDGMPVGFNVYVHPVLERTLPEGELGPDAQRALDLVSEADEVLLNWRTLLDHFDYLRVREAQHAMLSVQIMSRVMHWTLLEAVLVVSMAIGQVLYWKKFFEQRRYL
jgi:emp24/gp25L/p24 family/GOLD